MHLGIDASLSEQDALVIIRWIALQQQMFSEQLYLTIDQCGFMYSRCPVNQCLVINAGLSRSSHVEGNLEMRHCCHLAIWNVQEKRKR